MYGFLDESGAPGTATSNNDFLVASLVLFKDCEAMERSSMAIERLRERLGKTSDYEFHYSSNSTISQREFIKLLRNLEFRFITVAIRKNDFRKHASYRNLAEILVRELKMREFNISKIEMDSNPLLHAELRKQIKACGLRSVRIKEVKSHTNSLIQLTDYVVNISSKKAKNTPKSPELYRAIASKALVFIDVAD